MGYHEVKCKQLYPLVSYQHCLECFKSMHHATQIQHSVTNIKRIVSILNVLFQWSEYIFNCKLKIYISYIRYTMVTYALFLFLVTINYDN